MMPTALVSRDGYLSFAGQCIRVDLGHGGCRRDKREGDGATPLGLWPLRRVFYRPDRVAAPATRLPVQPLAPHDGWCDDPDHGDYNRLIRLPHPARHEILWRQDHVYDLILVLGHNDAPPIAGLGSAIFMHVSRPDRSPTQGCVAMPEMAFRRFLRWAAPCGSVQIGD